MASATEKLNRQFVKAASKGDLGRLERLLAEGAELEGRGGSWLGGAKRTALEQASFHAQSEAVNFLIDRGAIKNQADSDGLTPLMFAALSGYCGTVETLLKRGARMDITNAEGKTALDISIRNENTCATELMRKKSAEQAAEQREQARRQSERAAAAKAAQQAPVTQKPATPPLAPPKPEPKKENPDIVIFRQQAGDRTLEDVFNFVSLERITLIRKSFDGPVEAMTMQGFSQVESRAFLKKAIDEHQRRGGKVTEADIFPDTKSKISKLPGAEP